MTPTEVETFARRRYNAVGDNTWSSEEILDLIYDASLEMARYARVIENRYLTDSVASQSEYELPDTAIGVKRVEFQDEKLQPVTMREEDMLTLVNATVTTVGTPRYYFQWEESVFLSPAPESAITDAIRIYTYNEPQRITAVLPLEIPTQFHTALGHYVIGQMALKDLNNPLYDRQMERWKGYLEDARRWQRRKVRGDGFSVVQDEEILNTTIAGPT